MNTILVTGATGNIGRPLVMLLAAKGMHVRAVSRDPVRAALPAGVEAVESAIAGVAGSRAVFLNSRALQDDLGGTVEAAREAGVGRLVALSAINADDDFARQPSRVRGDRNKEVEELAVGSGLEWVSLRQTVFASNFADRVDEFGVGERLRAGERNPAPDQVVVEQGGGGHRSDIGVDDRRGGRRGVRPADDVTRAQLRTPHPGEVRREHRRAQADPFQPRSDGEVLDLLVPVTADPGRLQREGIVSVDGRQRDEALDPGVRRGRDGGAEVVPQGPRIQEYGPATRDARDGRGDGLDTGG